MLQLKTDSHMLDINEIQSLAPSGNHIRIINPNYH